MITFIEVLDDICRERFKHRWSYVSITLGSSDARNSLLEDAATEYAKQVTQYVLKTAAVDKDQFGDITVSKPGLSIRAQFAKDFMSAQVKHYGAANPKSLAKMAVEAADALIEQLNSEP